MKAILRWAGRNGAMVVIAGVLLGLAFPRLSEAARPLLGAAIFVFTFGSFLKLDGATVRAEAADLRRNALMVLWATFGVPAVVAAGVALARPNPELAQGLLFWSLVPASPACVAFATMLRLNPVICLLATVFGTAIAPLSIPILAAAFGGTKVAIDPIATGWELVIVVGGAALASLAVKRLARPFIAANPEVITGLAVCAMVLAGLGSMRGMTAQIALHPSLSLTCVALAYTLLFGFEILGTVLFWRYGRTAAFTAGLISGTRTITLAWVVLGDRVLPMADLFLATGMIAKYTAPGLTKWLLGRLLEGRAVRAELGQHHELGSESI